MAHTHARTSTRTASTVGTVSISDAVSVGVDRCGWREKAAFDDDDGATPRRGTPRRGQALFVEAIKLGYGEFPYGRVSLRPSFVTYIQIVRWSFGY